MNVHIFTKLFSFHQNDSLKLLSLTFYRHKTGRTDSFKLYKLKDFRKIVCYFLTIPKKTSANLSLRKLNLLVHGQNISFIAINYYYYQHLT